MLNKRFFLQIFAFFFFNILTYSLSAWPCEDTLITTQQHDALQGKATITTIYGTFSINEPILIELINCAPMQRLKEIRQLGVWHYAIKPDQFTRYDHSVGVFTLIRKTGGSLKEQIAGLLHDISHTAFSHVGAFFFVNDADKMDQFQDDMHTWYLHASGIDAILARHGYTVADIDPHAQTFQRLEQDLPSLCADRIDYNIRGALWDDLITAEEAQNIIETLHFKDGNWYFSNIQSAKKLAEQSLIMTQKIWASPENFVTGIWLADALHCAANLNIITKDDVHFSTDTILWKKLCSCNDALINHDVYKIQNCSDFFIIDENEYTHTFTRKFRGINPLVETEQGLQYLTDIDADFAHTYHTIRDELTQPLHIYMLPKKS